jgi:putative aminopeptidase FrvX
MQLLKEMCAIHAPSGNEAAMTGFVLDYVNKNKKSFKHQPEVFSGGLLRDCVILKFGKPRTAIFAHLDNIGFTVRYGTELVKIGGPKAKSGYKLHGKDSKGDIVCTLLCDENGSLRYDFDREIDRGTNLSFVSDFKETDELITSCYMDNRLGVWSALKVAENLEDGLIVFSCYEEVGGGSVSFLGKYMYENFGVAQALISDITWTTEGVKHGGGVAISLRDSGIPRRSYLDKIVALANKSGVKYQLEVESAGGSDGNVLAASPYPIDWCFVGASEDNVHSPIETVNKNDVTDMVEMYNYLMKNL